MTPNIVCVVGTWLLSTNGHAPLGDQRVPYGETMVLTIVVCKGPEFTGAKNEVPVTCKPGTSRGKNGYKFARHRLTFSEH